MEMATFVGKMARGTKENSKMTSAKERVSSLGRTAVSTKGNGVMASSTAKVSSLSQMALRELVFGRTDAISSGLMTD